MSKASKGNYYRKRTRDWLESLGYLVEISEITRRNFIGKDKVIYTKRDFWGADLIARNAEDLIFVQVKSNKAHISQGMKELNKGLWPGYVKRWVVYWPPRRRMVDGPDVVDVVEACRVEEEA
jgi:hypothetical protein